MEIAFRVELAAERVDLLGEVGDWRNPIRLARGDDGAFTTTLDLPRGVYQYKLLVDERVWTLDPRGDRTRSHLGQRNNFLVVDGAPEPMLFAAASPWVEEIDRGGVRVLVGVRLGHDDLRISFREDDAAPWSSAEASHAFDEDEHRFWVATLPTSSRGLSLRLEAGGAVHEARWSRTPASERAPSWWKSAVVYTVFVDRFRSSRAAATWEIDPGKERAAGGDLEGIRRSLDDLAELGVDTLYLTPVHVGASIHRYDLVDPLTVDPALGGEEAYDALVRDARTRGMRIVQDFSFAHAGRGFPPYEDVIVHGRASRWAPWFVWKSDGTLACYGKRTDAPLLDLENAEVQELALEAVAYWAKRGVAGLRLDMTAEVPIALGRRIRRRFRDLVPNGLVLGEVVPEHAWRWRAEGVVDASTDFGFHAIVRDLTCEPRASVEEAWRRLARLELVRGGDPTRTSVRFLSTHDHPRLASLAAARGALARLPAAYTMLLTVPGVPMLLYGEELGLRADDGIERELEDVWPDRGPMPWSRWNASPLRPLLRDLLAARRASPALREGETTLLHADASTLVVRRAAEGDVVDVAINFAGEPVVIELEDDELPRLSTLVQTGGCEAVGQRVTLGPFGALVMRRAQALGRAVSPAAARRNLVVRDRELIASRTTIEARPSRFFFSVTERCNLRCEHCITHAPSLTKSGAARTMTPAVVDALRGDLGLADYFAFVHGGESLTAPIFFDLLHAIRDARGAEPYVAHLLTNGVLLGEALAERLVASGVSSLSVSLDGATASTNDAIRAGGRFDDVVRNVASVTRWRSAARADLRVGLSFVVLAQNVSELVPFVELAARLGVDWVKLEEGVPASDFARRSLVSCTAPETRAAIEQALARGRELGLVVVDHTVERAVWRCRLDDATRAFLEADEHANRGAIHPCRTPWETVCIEPNGDVRVRDFFGPIVGNVTSAALAAMWNGDEAVRLRAAAIRARLCGAGPVTCVEG
ncbi:MAG: radical SAM protein [Deltaproteobacteria bacterium]|nr:radical SAM protein [Deltaproteobacteria bacterium]